MDYILDTDILRNGSYYSCYIDEDKEIALKAYVSPALI